MIVCRIDKNFTISPVKDGAVEIKARLRLNCLDYDDRNDLWCNEWGSSEPDPALAWVGRARRVPLPPYFLGADGEDSCKPHVAIEDVLSGSERD